MGRKRWDEPGNRPRSNNATCRGAARGIAHGRKFPNGAQAAHTSGYADYLPPPDGNRSARAGGGLRGAVAPGPSTDNSLPQRAQPIRWHGFPTVLATRDGVVADRAL